MTIRAHLGSQVVTGILAFLACQSALFLVAAGLALAELLTPTVVVAVIVASALLPFALLFFLRCPRCRGPLGSLVAHFGPFASLGKRISNCPFCGVSLDAHTELQPTVQADAASPRGLT
jgi:hypothetical protein